MKIGNIYKNVALLSPYIEILLRQIYWRNHNLFERYSPHQTPKCKDQNIIHVDFNVVIEWLKTQGIKRGDLLIVHSSYGALECTDLSPSEIIEKLLELIGPEGTLCMPVIRKYKEEIKAQKEGLSLDGITYKYDVLKTTLISGLLPYELMHWPGAFTSHFPYNPLCAVGPLAKKMMEHNLDEELPSPHGPLSSWKYCYDHGAKICSIGTDIEHHTTMVHVAEEAFGNWCVSEKEWYDIRKFDIIDENKEHKFVSVKNRKEKWGKLHLAELNFVADLKKKNIMISDVTEGGILVGFVDSQKLIPYLIDKNKNGYPYYMV